MQQQIALSADVQAGLIARAASLVTDHVMVLVALAFIGSVVGIATMQAVKLFIPPLDEAPEAERNARKLFLTRTAFIAGFCWTLVIISVYAASTVAPGALVAGTVAVGLALISGAATPLTFKLGKAAWAYAWQWIRKKLGKDGGPPDDGTSDITELKK